MQPRGFHDVNFPAKHALQFLDQADLVEDRSPGIEVNQEVEVAPFCGLSPSHGTKHSRVPSLVGSERCGELPAPWADDLADAKAGAFPDWA